MENCEQEKQEYIDKMIQYLPILRAALGLTQKDLGHKCGVSRQTIASVETSKRPLNWSLYLAFVCLFLQHEITATLMENFDVFDQAFFKVHL